MKRDAIVQAAPAQIGGIIEKDSVYAKFAYTASDGKTYPVGFAGFGMISAMERRVA